MLVSAAGGESQGELRTEELHLGWILDHWVARTRLASHTVDVAGLAAAVALGVAAARATEATARAGAKVARCGGLGAVAGDMALLAAAVARLCLLLLRAVAGYVALHAA